MNHTDSIRVVWVLEYAAQVWQQRIVDDRDETPHEEQRGEHSQGPAIASAFALRALELLGRPR
jgi:hypothetical protein